MLMATSVALHLSLVVVSSSAHTAQRRNTALVKCSAISFYSLTYAQRTLVQLLVVARLGLVAAAPDDASLPALTTFWCRPGFLEQAACAESMIALASDFNLPMRLSMLITVRCVSVLLLQLLL
mmetsp:Transcript_102291/g.329988  ORF Transcript_102291/g.329988 Transcript_102291/m.329988 type:complete len:123 (-) Transcript_102291:25-393(-)